MNLKSSRIFITILIIFLSFPTFGNAKVGEDLFDSAKLQGSIPYQPYADSNYTSVYTPWFKMFHVATDLQIQIVDKEGRSINNCEVSIGYTGFTLTEEVDETGILNELFTLAKGEYFIYIDSLDLYGRFYVNELTNDKSIIVVTLE